jgi:type VI secretion system protein ImpH
LAYELGQGDESNSFIAALLAVVGIGLPSLQQRQPVSDDALVFYSGHFGRNLPTAGALQQILSEYFERPVTVRQFQGRWISWPESEQSRLATTSAYATLGTDAVIGSRVWDVQGSFRLLIGPLSYEHFRGFLPDGEQMRELASLARSFVGPVLNFDVQLILTGSEIPPVQLSANPQPQAGTRLGWDTWLPAAGERPDANDAVFEVEVI